MDWLSTHDVTISCRNQNLTFKDSYDNLVTVYGKNGKPKLQLVSLTKLAKGLRKKQMVYAVTLNPTKTDSNSTGPEWLEEYTDIFPQELMQFSP